MHLHVYAADLARSPDGRWWVMADRTQAVSGAGYALENRLIVSRTFPQSVSSDLRVQHLARFFATMRDSLLHFAPKGDGAPLVVLLTPGPYNETYFEHTLLSRYLGFPLVEGGDLTVREGKVWLKTIGGLQARARHPAPPGRCLLRSAGTAQRFGAGRRGPHRVRAPWHGADRQRAGLRRAGIRRVAGLPAADRRAPAGPGTADALHGHLVVRRTGGAARCTEARRPAWCSSPPTRAIPST